MVGRLAARDQEHQGVENGMKRYEFAVAIRVSSQVPYDVYDCTAGHGITSEHTNELKLLREMGLSGWSLASVIYTKDGSTFLYFQREIA